jgi:hypothetical protein
MIQIIEIKVHMMVCLKSWNAMYHEKIGKERVGKDEERKQETCEELDI